MTRTRLLRTIRSFMVRDLDVTDVRKVTAQVDLQAGKLLDIQSDPDKCLEAFRSEQVLIEREHNEDFSHLKEETLLWMLLTHTNLKYHGVHQDGNWIELSRHVSTRMIGFIMQTMEHLTMRRNRQQVRARLIRLRSFIDSWIIGNDFIGFNDAELKNMFIEPIQRKESQLLAVARERSGGWISVFCRGPGYWMARQY